MEPLSSTAPAYKTIIHVYAFVDLELNISQNSGLTVKLGLVYVRLRCIEQETEYKRGPWEGAFDIRVCKVGGTWLTDNF